MAAREFVTVTVETEPPSTVRCPVTVQTRVWQLAQLVAVELGEVPGNVTIVAVGRKLDPLTRVIGVPEQVKFVARLHSKRRTEPFGVDDAKTPRLVPLATPPVRLKVTVRQDGCAPATVTVSPSDPVSVLRRLCDADAQGMVMQVGGRSIIDERQTFAQLTLGSGSEVHFVLADSERSGTLTQPPIARPHTSSVHLANSYAYLDGESDEAHLSPTSARRKFARLLRILFVDPDDEGYTYDLDVWCGRTISSLLQFVEEEPRYEILCDGRRVDPSATFLEATEGYDGTLFTFAPSAAESKPALGASGVSQRRSRPDGVPPLSHLTRPYSSPTRSHQAPSEARPTNDFSGRDMNGVGTMRSPNPRSPSLR